MVVHDSYTHHHGGSCIDAGILRKGSAPQFGLITCGGSVKRDVVSLKPSPEWQVAEVVVLGWTVPLNIL